MAQVKRLDEESPKPPAKRQRSAVSSNGSSKSSTGKSAAKSKAAKTRGNGTANGKSRAKQKKKPVEQEEEEEDEEVDEDVVMVDSEDEDFAPSPAKKPKTTKNSKSKAGKTATTKARKPKKKVEVEDSDEEEEDGNNTSSDDELFEDEPKSTPPKGKKGSAKGTKSTKNKTATVAKGKAGKGSITPKGKNPAGTNQSKQKPNAATTKSKAKSKSELIAADKENAKEPIPGWRPVLCATNLESYQWDMLEALGKRRKTPLKSEFDVKAEIMILQVLKPDDSPKRTMKLCKAIAAGMKLICFDWIQESIGIYGKWPDVAKYTHPLTRDPDVPGLFSDKEFYFGSLGNQGEHKDDLVEIVRLGGGKILTKKPTMPKSTDESDKIEPPSSNLILVEDPALSEQRTGRRASLIALKDSIPGSELVAPNWILDQCCPASRKETEPARKQEEDGGDEEEDESDADTVEPVAPPKGKPKKKLAQSKSAKPKAPRAVKNSKATKGGRGKAVKSKSEENNEEEYADEFEGETSLVRKSKPARGGRGGKRTAKSKSPKSDELSAMDIDNEANGQTSPAGSKSKATKATRGGKKNSKSKVGKEEGNSNEPDVESDKFVTPPRSSGNDTKVEGANGAIANEDVDMNNVEVKTPSNRIEVEATPETDEDLAEKKDISVPLKD